MFGKTHDVPREPPLKTGRRSAGEPDQRPVFAERAGRHRQRCGEQRLKRGVSMTPAMEGTKGTNDLYGGLQDPA